MEWISVKDRLPEETDCIVYGTPTCGATCGTNPIVTQARHREGQEFEFGEYDCGIEVTHWMPLPTPPPGPFS